MKNIYLIVRRRKFVSNIRDFIELGTRNGCQIRLQLPDYLGCSMEIRKGLSGKSNYVRCV